LPIKLLFIGDVMGRPGRRAVSELLPGLRDELGVDVVVANGENAAGGAGLTRDTSRELFKAGVDLLTGGNHLFDKPEGIGYIEREPRIIRPANYPPGTAGNTMGFVETGEGRVAVASVLGRIFMKPMDDPFRAARTLVDRAHTERARYLVMDVHAEASSEKMALGWYLDGEASVVVGTHTHVPTADERILPRGTAYITDVGMTGPYDSIIGMEKKPVLEHLTTGMRRRFRPATGDVRLCSVLVELDAESGRANAIRRVMRRLEEPSNGDDDR
jgi:metallophosphoesterase (TIGR00282 family)